MLRINIFIKKRILGSLIFNLQTTPRRCLKCPVENVRPTKTVAPTDKILMSGGSRGSSARVHILISAPRSTHAKRIKPTVDEF